MSRNKGKVWEREVASMFREVVGDAVKRGWQAREGHDAADVENVPLLWIEAKHHRVVNIAAGLKQAIDAAGKAKSKLWPIVIGKSNRCEPTATMQLVDFLKLYREWFRVHAVAEQMTEVLATLVPRRDLLVQLITAARGAVVMMAPGPERVALLNALAAIPNGVEKALASQDLGHEEPAPSSGGPAGVRKPAA